VRSIVDLPAFVDVSPEELQQLEGVLKKVGKRAEILAEKPRAILEVSDP
jgi:hypothetical protein